MTRKLSARSAISEAYSMFCRSPGQDPNLGFKSSFRALGNKLTRVVGVQTFSKKDPADFIAWAVMFAGQVISAVERQPNHIAHWLKYAYSDMYLPNDEANVVAQCWRDFQADCKENSKVSADKMYVLKHLVVISVQDYRYKVNTAQKKFGASEIARLVNESIYVNVKFTLMKTLKHDKATNLTWSLIDSHSWKIDASNWHRDWLPYFQKMQDILDTYDRTGLQSVAQDLKKIEKVFDTLT